MPLLITYALTYARLHELGSADAHPVERRFQSVTCGPTQLQAGPSQIYILHHHAMLTALIAGVIEAVHRGREILHVVRSAMRLEELGRVLGNLGPERELARHLELPGLHQQR